MDHLEQARKELAFLANANEESFQRLGTAIALQAIGYALVSIAENLDHFKKQALSVEVFRGDF